MTADHDRLRELAGKLTNASRRAIVRIGETWTREGAPGPARQDAYSLWWGRDGARKLIDRPRWVEPGRWEYRLTPLGTALRNLITEGERG